MAELTTTAYSLLSIGELKAFLGKDEASGVSDALLVQVIEGVSRWVETYCGRHFLSREYDHDGTTLPLLMGTGSRKLWLQNYPVTAISSLMLTPEGPALTEGWNANFTLDKASGIITLAPGYTFPSEPWVACTYTGGYLPTGGVGGVTLGTADSMLWGWQEGAADLRLSILKQAAEFVRRRDRQRDGIQSRTVAGETMTYFDAELLTDVRAVWNRYRQPRIL